MIIRFLDTWGDERYIYLSNYTVEFYRPCFFNVSLLRVRVFDDLEQMLASR